MSKQKLENLNSQLEFSKNLSQKKMDFLSYENLDRGKTENKHVLLHYVIPHTHTYNSHQHL